MEDKRACACAHHYDGSVTTSLCSIHATSDPCQTWATWTGKRRKGSIVRGVCTACGWRWAPFDYTPWGDTLARVQPDTYAARVAGDRNADPGMVRAVLQREARLGGVS